jgi:hypothetical protein
MTITESKTAQYSTQYDDSMPVAVAVEVPNGAPKATAKSNAPTTTTTTTTTTQVIGYKMGLSSHPENMTCQFCNQSMVTRTSNEIGGCTIVIVIILVILFWPLFWLPLVCKDVSFFYFDFGIFHLKQLMCN